MPVVETETVNGNIALIRINRPEQKNALSPEVVVRYAHALRTAAENPDIRVIVLTGTGPVFCSGADLALLIPLITGVRKPSDEYDHLLLNDLSAVDVLFGRDFDAGKPLIACINGDCLAGGFEVMLTSDIRVAAASARFALREAAVGLIPGGGGTARLPKEAPPAVAIEMLITADFFSAQHMLAHGLINAVEPTADAAMKRALALAATIANNSPNAVRLIRRVVRTSRHLSDAEAVSMEQEASMEAMVSPDAREGPRAFKEKRAPQWAKL